MKYSSIGSTEISLPCIIFGTSALGNLYASHSPETKENIIRECFRSMPGKPVVFDTAGKYGAGLALEMLGKCLKNLAVPKEDVLISNKLGWLQTELKTPEPTFEKGVWYDLKHDAVQDISYDGILRCWEQGNQLLGGDYMPSLVSVHDPDEYIESAPDAETRTRKYNDILDAYGALSELKSRGEIKAIGIGAKNWKIIHELSKDIQFDWIMFANSLTLLTHSAELIEFMSEMHEKGVAIINSAVFNSGFLVGSNYLDYKLLDPNDAGATQYFEWRKKFFSLCEKYSVPPSHACIQFGMSHPGIMAVALNTSKPGNVQKNVSEVSTPIPEGLFSEMKVQGLIEQTYPWV